MGFGKLRLSRSRKTSSSSNETGGTTTPPPNDSSDGPDLSKTTSKGGLIRSLTGGFRSHRASKSMQASRSEYPHLHKPFTRQNMEHQKILNSFEWNFGRNYGHSIYSGISPCASRRVSFDYQHALPPTDLATAASSSAKLKHAGESSSDESDNKARARNNLARADGDEDDDAPEVDQVETVA